ncbi:CpaF family protein [Caldinitratiruptor microaerophilus]|uniref:Secretion protein n=1 Tax=Caldinitratiruptor microaerophilus TaxID=671077 RepID=A0AA35G8Z4_9FIRM|nr:ATPase, T2SS/T4P/T4SS family [Caldinitratiruptor microaerophilus]BDG59764.1 secretion protein [Caldinitratiruptor microaerophilus]
MAKVNLHDEILRRRRTHEGHRTASAGELVTARLLQRHAPAVARALADPGAAQEAREAISAALRMESLTSGERDALARQLASQVLGFGKLQPLVDDPTVTEVLVNGPGSVWVERAGRLERAAIDVSGPELLHLAQRLAAQAGRELTENRPLALLTLEGGIRVRIVQAPATRQGVVMAIRKPPSPGRPIGPQELVALGSLTPDMLDFFALAVRARLNILVLGETGSGKTTVIRNLLRFVSPEERLVIVEQAAELVLGDPDLHVVNLEAVERPRDPIPIYELFRAALQLRPDRFVLGELTGPHEAADLIEAMSAAFRGGITSFHGDSPEDVIRRLTLLLMRAGFQLSEDQTRRMLHETLDLLVFCRRFRQDGSRKVVRVVEVCSLDSGEPFRDLFRFRYRGLDPGGRVVGDFEYRAHLTAPRRRRAWEFGVPFPEEFGGTGEDEQP